MYVDPTQIRTHEVKVRLSDQENALLTAVVNMNGGQRAALCREIILQGAAEIMEYQDEGATKP